MMHSGESRVVQKVANTGGWTVNDGRDSHGVRMLPLVSGQVGHVLPDITVQHTAVVQQLYGENFRAVLR